MDTITVATSILLCLPPMQCSSQAGTYNGVTGQYVTYTDDTVEVTYFESNDGHVLTSEVENIAYQEFTTIEYDPHPTYDVGDARSHVFRDESEAGTSHEEDGADDADGAWADSWTHHAHSECHV